MLSSAFAYKKWVEVCFNILAILLDFKFDELTTNHLPITNYSIFDQM